MAQNKRDGRKKRKPLGSPVSKLAVKTRAGYVRRWINDASNRLHLAIEAGWEHVETGEAAVSDAAQEADSSTHINQVVGTHDNGEPLIAYLMEIKVEWYNADQKEKQKQLDAVDESIRQGGTKENGQYVPKTGIKIKRGQ